MIAFQSSSWVHFETKHRKEVEEDVHVDLEWKSYRNRGGNLSWAEDSASVTLSEQCSVLEEEQTEETVVRARTSEIEEIKAEFAGRLGVTRNC